MLDLRDLFFLPTSADAIEFRAFTHGLMPRTVPAMMQHFVEDWKTLGVDAWNQIPNHWHPDSDESVGWWTLPEYLGDHFIGPLLGAPTGTCIWQPNVNWVMQCILSDASLFVEKKEVIITEAEFPSVQFSVHRWARLHNFDVKTVPLDQDGFVDREAILNAISDQTSLVILSHVGFTTGEKLESTFLRQVASKTKAHGGIFAIDGYHATGSIAVEVLDYNVDIYFGGLLKEACGSSGNAYVYVRKGCDLRPNTTGWFGDAQPFAFNATPQAHPTIRRRFMSGTSPVASMYHSVEGVRLLLDAGLTEVRQHSLALTAACIEHADAISLPLSSPRKANRRGAMIILEVTDADRLCTFLKHQGVFTDSRRGKYLRMAPFVWNTLEEVDRAFVLLQAALKSKRYQDARFDSEKTGPVT